MIRTDEIYRDIFWSFVQKNVPNTRVVYCDPPGETAPDSLASFSSSWEEHNYIYFHDQEPLHLDVHQPLFEAVEHQAGNLCYNRGPYQQAIVTSEYNSEFVEHMVEHYKMKPYYYFFHGWASLEWFRGYNYTHMMPEPEHRSITRTFIAPNRIVAGKRNHRLLMLYQLFKRKLTNNWISCPETCPAENVKVADAVGSLTNIYPDIETVFQTAQLPMDFPGETGAPMHSYKLSLFDQCADSLLYLVSETVADGRRCHLTEKAFKPLCLKMPFVLVSTAGSLEYLRSYGFKTFGEFWDESYDQETDTVKRIERIADVLEQLNSLTMTEKQNLLKKIQPILEHNYNHFYNGAFEGILRTELEQMLDTIKQDLA